MKNFLRHSAYFAFLAAITLFSSCAEDDVFSQLFGRAMPMRLSGGIVPFDADSTSATRAGEWQWPDGAQLYLQLYNGNTRIPATATFNKDTETWTIGNVNGLAKSGKSEAYYFEKGLSSISYSNGVYGDSNGTYTMNDDYIVISNNLEPLTSRVRFLNVQPSISIKIDGISSYKSYDPSTNNFTTSDESITLNNASGDSPYCYGWFTDEQTRKMTVTTYIPNSDDPDSKTFVRSFGENVLKKGVSGTLSIPTKENYESLSWTWENKPIEFEAVDLGLPSGTKWANMNLGAEKPEDRGDYYAWGETTIKDNYSWKTYILCDGTEDRGVPINLTKYSTSWQFNMLDNKCVLETIDDAATTKLGDLWRLPTYEECKELIDNCDWTYTTKNGVNGFLVQSRAPNKNTIFLPIAGYRSGIYSYVDNISGYYWSSSLETNYYPHRAWNLWFQQSSGKAITSTSIRSLGQSIRPVYGPILSVSPDTLLLSKSEKESIVNVRANVAWRVESNPDWLEVKPAQGTGDRTVTLTVTQENTSSETRPGTIKFVTTDGSNLIKEIQVEQESKTLGVTEQTFTVNGNGITVRFKMILVEHGEFKMGNDLSDFGWVKPAHNVTLTNDFYMGETEVTQVLWYAVMGQKPTSDGPQWVFANGLGDNFPAYWVSWDDCQEFITKLNQLTGQQFRLPTEAEWEFAAQGGRKSHGYNYSGGINVVDVAWCKENSSNQSHIVATKQHNELGLYDMSGNVCEWCNDWYRDYTEEAQTNPTGPPSASGHVIRGGSWSGSASECSVSYRPSWNDNERGLYYGLRLAL